MGGITGRWIQQREGIPHSSTGCAGVEGPYGCDWMVSGLVAAEAKWDRTAGGGRALLYEARETRGISRTPKEEKEARYPGGSLEDLVTETNA